ncbi:MAG: hypothetical protein GY822_02485 [Deltaproteobacteria bacterium]|nr:hypothetical protein [Deltaproteobacteria bacterium]
MPSHFGSSPSRKRRLAAFAAAFVLHAAAMGFLLSVAKSEPEQPPDVEKIEFEIIDLSKVALAEKVPEQKRDKARAEKQEKTATELEAELEHEVLQNTTLAPANPSLANPTPKKASPKNAKSVHAKSAPVEQETKQEPELAHPELKPETLANPTIVVDKDLHQEVLNEEGAKRNPAQEGPRAAQAESLLGHVMQRKEQKPLADPLGLTRKKILSALHPLPDFSLSAEQRLQSTTENRVNELFEVHSNPNDELNGKRVLEPTNQLGYRWVDEKTGLPPEKAPAPKMAGLARSSAGGITFKDKERPLSNQTRDALVPTDDGGFSYDRGAWKAKIFPDGSIAFDENIGSFSTGEKPPPIYEKLGIPAADLTSISFDATDIIMRLAGMDPYSEAKRCFLEDVAPIRDELRSKWKSEKLGGAVAVLRTRLDELWSESERPQTQRRRIIFEIFDSCNDEQAGNIARRVIYSWIRQRLPASSPDAFTLAELQVFAKERSELPAFLPYGPLSNLTTPKVK